MESHLIDLESYISSPPFTSRDSPPSYCSVTESSHAQLTSTYKVPMNNIQIPQDNIAIPQENIELPQAVQPYHTRVWNWLTRPPTEHLDGHISPWGAICWTLKCLPVGVVCVLILLDVKVPQILLHYIPCFILYLLGLIVPHGVRNSPHWRSAIPIFMLWLASGLSTAVITDVVFTTRQL